MQEYQYLHHFFPSKLLEYFTVKGFSEVVDPKTEVTHLEILLEENNVIFGNVDGNLYESKDFTEVVLQDFPVRGKAVFLRMRRRRWRLKTDKKVIHRNDFSFVAAGSGFTQELSDFLKDSHRYAT